MSPTEFDTLVLDALEEGDAPELHAWRADPQVRDGALGYPFPSSMEAEREWIAAQKPQGTPNNICLAVRSNQGVLLGYVQLRGIDWIARTAEFGIVIGRARGQGVGQRALDLSIKYFQEQLGLRRLWLRVAAFNVSAISLYKRRGFQHEGTLRSHVYRSGGYHDVEIFALDIENDKTSTQNLISR